MSVERLKVGPRDRYSPRELAIHLSRYTPVRKFVQEKYVLDIACGEGYAAYGMLKHWGAKKVVGVDLNPSAIFNARKNFAMDGISFQKANAVDWLNGKGAKFDIITCVETIEHVENPLKLLRALPNRLRPHGVILITCPNDHWYYGQGPSLNEYHLSTWNFDEFREQTESILGPASAWLLGTRCEGFTSVLYKDLIESSWKKCIDDSFSDLFSYTSVPPLLPNVPSPERCLYYTGVWGVNSNDLHNLQSGAVVATGPEPTKVVGRVADLLSDGTIRVAIVGQKNSYSLSQLKEISETLNQKAAISFFEYSDIDASQSVLQALNLGVDHIRLVGPHSVTAFYNIFRSSFSIPSIKCTISAQIHNNQRSQLGSSAAILGLIDLTVTKRYTGSTLESARRFLNEISASKNRHRVVRNARIAAWKILDRDEPETYNS